MFVLMIMVIIVMSLVGTKPYGWILLQGLEGYSRDPGFGQNTVRDSGKRKTS